MRIKLVYIREHPVPRNNLVLSYYLECVISYSLTYFIVVSKHHGEDCPLPGVLSQCWNNVVHTAETLINACLFPRAICFKLGERPSSEFLPRIICPYFKLWVSVGGRVVTFLFTLFLWSLVSCFLWKWPLAIATLVPRDLPVLGFRLQVKISHITLWGGTKAGRNGVGVVPPTCRGEWYGGIEARAPSSVGIHWRVTEPRDPQGYKNPEFIPRRMSLVQGLLLQFRCVDNWNLPDCSFCDYKLSLE